jgi:hypothetical protein
VADVWASIAGRPNQFAQSNVFTTSADSLRDPRSLQFTGSIEHRLGRGLLLSYQLNYLNTVHLPRIVDHNVPPPMVQAGDQSLRPFFGLRSGTPRPNPNLGAVYVLDSNARSTYIANSFRAQYRVKRAQFMAQYTLSYARSDDDLLWPFTATTYLNPFDLKKEWGWSSLDARHRGTGFALFDLGRGFEMTGAFQISSGLPVDATTGEDTAELLQGAIGNRPFQNPGVPFSRNGFRNLSYRSVDLRLLKSFVLKEDARLQLSVEAFNLFNIDNVAFASAYDYPNNPAFIYGLGVLSNGQHAPPNPGFLLQRAPSGGYDPSTMVQQGGPLQIQLGARFLF